MYSNCLLVQNSRGQRNKLRGQRYLLPFARVISQMPMISWRRYLLYQGRERVHASHPLPPCKHRPITATGGCGIAGIWTSDLPVIGSTRCILLQDFFLPCLDFISPPPLAVAALAYKNFLSWSWFHAFFYIFSIISVCFACVAFSSCLLHFALEW